MMELPAWAHFILDLFYYVFVVPFLPFYFILCIVLLLSPLIFALWGKAPPIDRISLGLLFCSWVVIAVIVGQ